MVKFIAASALVSLTTAQIFLHSPRGSNNRLNEKTANNANPYRLFFANHNNDFNRRGGYNVGENQKDDMQNENQQYHMKYFMSGTDAPSWLTVEWTQLLGCGVDEDGDRIHNCEVVIQTMCQDDTHPESITNDKDSIKEVENAYTIKNGDKTDTIKYKSDGRDIADPSGRCYIDAGDRDLPKFERIPRNQDSSIQWCKNRCKAKGYIYAGVQWYEQCFCGNEFGKHGISPNQGDCKTKCHDKEGNICGGGWRNNVYLSGLVEPKNDAEDRKEKLERRDEGSNSKDYGLHESWESYERCPHQEYFAETDGKKVKRAGFECPHERENYPVKYGTQWTDVAYFTDNLKDCEAVHLATREPKYECVEYYDSKKQHRIHKSEHTSETECTDADGDWLPFYQFKEYTSITTESNCVGKDLVWGRALDYQAIADDKLTVPRCLRLPVKAKCLKNPNTRQNYLGMTDDTNEAPRFQWALPIYEKNQRCVMRIRHIISNNDEDTVSSDDKDIRQATGSSLYLALPQKHSNNNKVVFQDRSHVFKLLTRPSEIPQDQTLHNIVVRGKRGNIVQTFPAVEYDFCPNNLKINNGDAVQFQWTGSNNHDNDGHSDGQAGDDGEGQGGTDRSNMIQLYYNKVNFPLPGENHTMFENAEFLWSSKDSSSDIAPFEAAIAHATSGYYWSAKDVKDNKSKLDRRLNNANPSFQGVVFKPQADQKYYYVGMRNNNFSNRSQKGKLVIGNPVDNDAAIRESLRRPKPVDECSKYE